jgi:tetratricopeptide (TPR) repeat protein
MPVPEIWGNVPQRNKNFTGREDLLEELRRRAGVAARTGAAGVTGQPEASATATAILPQALYGLGGVGKTQLAIEYAYLYAGNYQLVWWIPAEQIALVRSALAALAPRLGITGIPPGRVEDLVAAVIDALRRGKPYDRWLLVFDNADQPELIREYMPPGPGHVMVTSRNRGWSRHVHALQVDVFSRDESLAYLQGRVEGITLADAERLAEELGDLPLALEQAAALLAETVMTASVYLDLLAEESDRVLGENPPPADYPVPVAAAWSLSVTRLREQTPYAMQLLQLCAFFGPAPISLDLLDRGRYVLEPPLRDVLRDRILMGRAIRALGRYSLAKIDNYRRTLEVHRIIQRLIRNELDAEVQSAMRHDVHLLLAASDPGDPDDFENWPKYAELLTHENPAQLVTSEVSEVRRLEQNIVRYLYVTGDYKSALAAANKALEQWTEDSGEGSEYVLIMSRLKAQVLRAVGRYHEAYELAKDTFEKMRELLGVDHEETLILMNGLCVDLRVQGDFKGSLELMRTSVEQHRAVFGTDHPRTFAAANNLAEDLELNSDYAAARKLYEELYQEKRAVYISDNHPQVLLTLNAVARAMREEGYFLEAREKARQAYNGYRDLVRQHTLPEGHPMVMLQVVDFSTASRAAGTDPESLALAQEAYEAYRRAFGTQHAATLAASFNLGNAQRIVGELESARQLLITTEKQCNVVFGEDHPYTLASALNLSIIYRRQGDAESAVNRLTEIRSALVQSLGPKAHPALICAVNLANALSDVGDAGAAVKVNEETHPQLAELLGADHPHTLTCAANLALDLRKLGEAQRADDLARDTVARYRQRLGDDHPEVRAAAAGERQDLGIEVPVLF